MRSEVDCVNAVPEITEIKAKRATDANTAYYQTVWWQMFFGRTQSLLRGLHQPNPPGRRVRFTSITAHTFAAVGLLALMDDPTATPPLESLVALIQWIRGQIADGESKTFTFTAFSQECAMT